MAEDAPKPPPNRALQLVLLFFLLGVAALIGVPAIMMAGRAPIQRHGAGVLRIIAEAEEEFRSNDRDDNQVKDYWVGDVSQLYFRKGKGEQIRLIELTLAMADASPSAPLPGTKAKSCYRFVALKTDETGAPYDRGGGLNPDKFAFCAYPEPYGGSEWFRPSSDRARTTFILNQAGAFWKKDTHGAPVTQWPKDPAAEGWTRLD